MKRYVVRCKNFNGIVSQTWFRFAWLARLDARNNAKYHPIVELWLMTAHGNGNTSWKHIETIK